MFHTAPEPGLCGYVCYEKGKSRGVVGVRIAMERPVPITASFDPRLARRVSLGLEARLVTLHGTYTCRIDDLSRLGALLTLREQLLAGDDAVLQCGMLDMLAEVVRCADGLAAVRFVVEEEEAEYDPVARERASNNRRFFRLALPED